MLIFAAVLANVLTLDSDGAVTRAREKHAQLLIMMHSPHDHACTLAAPMFRNLADAWSGPRSNTTFALADQEVVPQLSKVFFGPRGGGENSLPAYALYIKGIGAPVFYKGGWSEKSIGKWLRTQTEMQPAEVNSAAALRAAVDANAHGLALVGFLTESQRSRRLLEVAARSAQAPAAVILGNEALADELGADLADRRPCVLVVRRHETRWPLLTGALTQSTVEAFVRERGMPSLVSIGDSNRSFSMQVRKHPLQVHVLLMHRSGQNGPHAPSDEALDLFQRVAARHDGTALFLAYDFFDNDPDAFAAHKVYASELPVVLAVHERGGFNERTWRLPRGSGGDNGILEEEIDQLVERALSELEPKEAGTLTAAEQQSVFEAHEGFWRAEVDDSDTMGVYDPLEDDDWVDPRDEL